MYATLACISSERKEATIHVSQRAECADSCVRFAHGELMLVHISCARLHYQATGAHSRLCQSNKQTLAWSLEISDDVRFPPMCLLLIG